MRKVFILFAMVLVVAGSQASAVAQPQPSTFAPAAAAIKSAVYGRLRSGRWR